MSTHVVISSEWTERMALTDLNFRSNAHNFQLVSENCKITAAWWALRNCELKQHKTIRSVCLSRNAQIQRDYDYQYSTVDSCLKVHCDAIENLLTFLSSRFLSLCATTLVGLLSPLVWHAYNDSPITFESNASMGLVLLCYSISCQLLNYYYVLWMPIQILPNYNILSAAVFSEVELRKCLRYLFFCAKHERAKFFLTMFRDKIPGKGKFMSSIRWWWL